MVSFNFIIRILIICASYGNLEAVHYVGVGRADCTGPVAEITLMGYGDPLQLACGLHLRQFARAFIFDDTKSRVLFITVDAAMVNHPVKEAVIEKLSEIYPNGTYNLKNTLISGTHTHSAPGGQFKDLLLDITSFGFVKQSFNSIVDGIVRAVQRAHDNVVEARIILNIKELLNTSINRSPASYLLNPEEERARYSYNVDKHMTQLKFIRKSDNTIFGALHWFAVHGTSMNNTNCLVSSDNIGYASLLLESSVNKGFTAGKGPFVGAFASTNLGDVSPNTKGPICILTGEPCDYLHSTCGGNSKYCIAFGPGKDMTESTEIIAKNLFKKGKELLDDEEHGVELTGDIGYIHKFVYMPNQTATVELKDGSLTQVKGCLPALGYSFGAGTTDGPGLPFFAQGTKTDNQLWTLIRNVLAAPTQEDKDCHHPKPILLMTGRMKFPYEWDPSVVTTQILKIGNLFIAGVPGEFTTMSGRRLREAVYEEVIRNGGDQQTYVVIAGLSNVYTHYVATYEEYQLQRYEGASTLFGPNSLSIYIKLFRELAAALVKGNTVTDEGTPYKFPKTLVSLLPPVLKDSSGFHHFGDCITQPNAFYHIGDTVYAVFVSGHPKNSVLQEDTFLTVEKEENNTWKTIATDASWDTKFLWKRGPSEMESRATIKWKIDSDVEPGLYRITHHGYYKPGVFETIRPYFGRSNNFTVATSQRYTVMYSYT